MTLFTKYNRINIVVTILIFLAASTAFYFTLNFILLEQVDDDLKIEQREINAYVKQFNRLPENIKVKDQSILYTPVVSEYTGREIKTADQREAGGRREEKLRQLRFGLLAAGQWYKVSVSKSLEETDDFIHSVVIISVVTILIILMSSFLINQFVLKKLWRPFNQSLDTLRTFRISEGNPLTFATTEIDEFRLMNSTLADLTQRAQVDYLSLKTFSENASHEIQTPIAIIQSKLDLLIQDEQLTEMQSKTVQVVYDAILRLSRLNSSLLLLAKIENRQYTEVERLNLKTKVEEKIYEFNELWHAQQLQVMYTLDEGYVTINPHLAEILLNNILSNATKYNYSRGTIGIELSKNRLVVRNTSYEPELHPDEIFQRFYKSSTGSAGYGLGLSLIKQIIHASSLSINYRFNDNQHWFIIEWEE